MATVIGKLWGKIKMVLTHKPRYESNMYLTSGAWTINDPRDVNDHHFYDKKLAAAIIQLFYEEDVLTVNDFGCGKGDYVHELNRLGFQAKGYDGNRHTPAIAGKDCNIADLHLLFHTIPVEWIISLEVGEHIPKKYESTFLSNLTRHAKKGIILSWAVPGQHGLGHVNCQPNIHIEHEMLVRGFVRDKNTEFILRSAAKLQWFKNTIMVYRPK